MTEPRTVGIDEAARRLGDGFTVDWLKKACAARKIPHTRSGNGRGRAGKIGFTEAHLDRIVAMFTVEPEAGMEPGDFTPITRRRSA